MNSAGPTWDPIPDSIMEIAGACPVGASIPTADGAVPQSSIPLPDVKSGASGRRGDIENAKVVGMRIGTGLVVAWVVVKVLTEALVGVPVVRLEGLGL